jgi:hypothetical protein
MNSYEANSIRSSVKSFLEKMKACDASIPEELAEDALEMAEEVKDATSCINDEEEDILEVTKDEEEVEKEDLEKKIEDSMVRVLRRLGITSSSDTSMKSLDEAEKELEEDKACDEDEDESNTLDEDGEEEVTVNAEKINEKDDMLRFIRKMKPIIASVSDAKTRKMLSDQVAKMARRSVTSDTKYADILKASVSAAKDNATVKTTADSDYEFGMKVAAHFNPHYKKED